MRHYKNNRLNLRLTCVALFGSLFLSACGIKGGLQTPPPLWGDDITARSQTAETDDNSVLDDNALDNNDESDLYGDSVNDPFNQTPN